MAGWPNKSAVDQVAYWQGSGEHRWDCKRRTRLRWGCGL